MDNIYCNNSIAMGSNPPRASFGSTMLLMHNTEPLLLSWDDFFVSSVEWCSKWTVQRCIVLYGQMTFYRCSLFIFMLDRWYGVRSPCFRVGSNRQYKASPCGCGRSSALSFSTCPTNPICRVKAGFNGQPMSHSVIEWLVKSACLFFKVSIRMLIDKFIGCTNDCLFKHQRDKARQEPHDEAYTQGTPFLSWLVLLLLERSIKNEYISSRAVFQRRK